VTRVTIALRGRKLLLQIRESGLVSQGPSGAQADSAHTCKAQLLVGSGWLAWAGEDGKSVTIDFEQERRSTIDRQRGTYSDDSLYVVVGSRHIELPNRAHVHAVLSAANGPASDFEPFFVEHQLAITDPSRRTTINSSAAAPAVSRWAGLRSFIEPAQADIHVRRQGNEAVCNHQGKVLLSHASTGVKDVAAVAGFVQFIRHRYGGHPLILKHLTALDFVPTTVTLEALTPLGHFPNTVRIQVDQCEPADLSRPSTFGLREATPFDGDAAGDTIRSAREASRQAVPESVSARLAAAIEAVRHGDAFEGMLSFFELTLETDVSMPPVLAEAVKVTLDTRVRALIGAIAGACSAKSNEDAMFIIAIYERLAAAAGKPHVLWAMEAGLRSACRQTKEARELLTRAVEANPWLTGAYKDLGDGFLRTFEVPRAWACWDTARRLSPHHPLVASVARFEEMLRREHPEYFTPTPNVTGQAAPAARH